MYKGQALSWASSCIRSFEYGCADRTCPSGGFAVRNGEIVNSYTSDHQIDDYSVSGHSGDIRKDVWRYNVGRGWAADWREKPDEGEGFL